MMLTGLYPHSNGVLANCNTNGAENGYELAADTECWSDILSENGYSLGYIGKWHLDPEKPWALVVSMNPPHMPYQRVPDRYLEMYADATDEELINRPNVDLEGDTPGARLARRHMKNYLAQCTGVDDQFGRILATLSDSGLEEDTIVVFTSDHGNCLGSHEEVSKNNPYEESMRVPFVIRWTGTMEPRRDDLLLSTPDIHPSILALMGLEEEVGGDVEGRSRAQLFLTGEGERPTSQPYIWIPYGHPALGRRGVRTHRYTLSVEKAEDGTVTHTLFDNVEDPYQLENVAVQQPQIVSALVEEELKPWLRRTGDPWLVE